MPTVHAKTINTCSKTMSGQNVNGPEGVYSVAPSPPLDQLSALNVLLKLFQLAQTHQGYSEAGLTGGLDVTSSALGHSLLNGLAKIIAWVRERSGAASVNAPFVSLIKNIPPPRPSQLVGFPIAVPDVPAPGKIESRFDAPKTTVQFLDLNFAPH